MQNLVSLNVFGGQKSTRLNSRTRQPGSVGKHKSAQASSSSSDSLRRPKINTEEEKELVELVFPPDDENWPLRDHLPTIADRTPPLPPPPSDQLSNYVDAPADERDEIIEALTSELEHEQYLKTKTKWELDEDYLEELDNNAPTVLFQNFHGKIVIISEMFFPSTISWGLLGSRIAPRVKNLEEMPYFPKGIKIPCTPETWDAVQQHPDMTCSLFVEGIISNTLAYKMCNCPTFQAEGELAKQLEIFYHHCQSVNADGHQGAEWMALTLQMMHKMLYSDIDKTKEASHVPLPKIKPVEESTQTRDLMWGLTDTLRILREAIDMPFDGEEWSTLMGLTQDLVAECFKLSVQWHSKPLAFKQYGMTWFSEKTLQACSDLLSLDLTGKNSVLNWEEVDKEQNYHVIAVISPILFREEWESMGKQRKQVTVWTKPSLLVAPGPPPLEAK